MIYTRIFFHLFQTRSARSFRLLARRSQKTISFCERVSCIYTKKFLFLFFLRKVFFCCTFIAETRKKKQKEEKKPVKGTWAPTDSFTEKNNHKMWVFVVYFFFHFVCIEIRVLRLWIKVLNDIKFAKWRIISVWIKLYIHLNGFKWESNVWTTATD